jgi:hypothetical protein
MLSEEAIRRILRANRVVPLKVANPHGPLGLKQLAAAVAAQTLGGSHGMRGGAVCHISATSSGVRS